MLTAHTQTISSPQRPKAHMPSPGLPRSSKLFSSAASRKAAPRPSISGPVGPVRSSRGPDLSRSQNLVVVKRIEDCASESSSVLEKDLLSPLLPPPPLPPTATRCLSASFPGAGSVAGSPTVGSCDVNATARMQLPSVMSTRNRFRETPVELPAARPVFKGGTPATHLTRTSTMSQSKLTSPAMAKNKPLPPLPKSKIPKSRTMGVLRDLRSSLSRSSLNIRSTMATAVEESSCEVPSSDSSNTLTPSVTVRPQLSQPSFAVARESTGILLSRPLSDEITSAMPSAYWSGRFMALQDRFSTESLPADSHDSASDNEDYIPLAQRANRLRHKHAKQALYQSTRLPSSNTTSALPNFAATITPSNTDFESDILCHRVFAHLDSRCRNAEAKQSLHDWQQAYARLHGRPTLLPRGGTMDSRGRMARFLGNGGTHALRETRKSLSSLRELASSSLGKIASGTKGSAARSNRTIA